MVEPYPSEKYEFVNGKDDIPYIVENKSHVWNHQPVCYYIRPYFLGISPYIGLIYGRYLQSIGSWDTTSWEPNEEFYGSKGPSPARLAKRKICQNGFLVTPCSLLYVYIHLYIRVSYFNLFILILSFWDAFEKPKTSMIIQVRPQPLSWINCGVQSCSRPNPKP